MFLKKNWLPITVFLLVIVGVSLYWLQTRPPKEPITIIKPVEVEPPKAEAPVAKPPPPGETHESGHWHGDEWHTGSHDVPAEAATPVDAQIAQPINPQLVEQAAQASIPRQAFPARTQEYYDAFETWKAWEDKFSELADEYSRLNHAFDDLLPTEEEAIRFENDENYKRELGRKVTEAAKKIAEVETKMREHAAKRPPIPYIQ